MTAKKIPVHSDVQLPARFEIIPGFSVIMESSVYPLTEESSDGYISWIDIFSPIEKPDFWFFKVINNIVTSEDLNLINLELIFKRLVDRLTELLPDRTRMEALHLKTPMQEYVKENPIRISRFGRLKSYQKPENEILPLEDVDYFNLWAGSADTVVDNTDYIPDWIRDEVSFWLVRLPGFQHYDQSKVELAMALWFHNHEGTKRHLECIERELPAVYRRYLEIEKQGELYVNLASLGGLLQQHDYNTRIKCHNVMTRLKSVKYGDDCHNPQAVMASMYYAVDVYEELCGCSWTKIDDIKGDIAPFCNRHKVRVRDALTDVPKKWD